MLNKWLSRCSIRNFKKQPIINEQLQEIISIANSAPTSSNAHQYSICLVQNPNLKQQLAIACFNQNHVAEAAAILVYNVDLTGINTSFDQHQQNIDDSLKLNIVLTSMTDLAISATMVQDYCWVTHNIGSCFIGAIRWNIKQVQQILKLPEYIIPVLGICLGYYEQTLTPKPKLNKVFMDDQYSEVELQKRMDEYDWVMDQYYLAKHPEQPSEGYYQYIFRTYDKNYKRNHLIDYSTINQILSKVFK